MSEKDYSINDTLILIEINQLGNNTLDIIWTILKPSSLNLFPRNILYIPITNLDLLHLFLSKENNLSQTDNTMSFINHKKYAWLNDNIYCLTLNFFLLNDPLSILITWFSQTWNAFCKKKIYLQTKHGLTTC